jgi:hypothetical protein
MDENLKPLQEFNAEGIDGAARDIAGDAPKIGWGEIFLITPLLLFVDFVELMVGLLEFVPVAGQVILLPVSLLCSAVGLFITGGVQVYLFFKHIKNYTFLLVGVADSIPLVSDLPLRTAGWLVTVFMTNSKKISKITSQIPAGKAAKALSKLP